MVYSQNKARELLSLIGEYHSNLLTRLGFFGKMDDEQKGVFDGVHYLVDKLRGWIGARDSREKTTAYKVLVKAKWFKDEEHAKRFLDNLSGIPILIRQDNKQNTLEYFTLREDKDKYVFDFRLETLNQEQQKPL